MENPVRDIEPLIKKLCVGSRKVQEDAIKTYFTPKASFIHPFCRTGSSPWSKWMILCIFHWYKALSPEIDIQVQSVAFDEAHLLLYVSIFQIFKIWFIPFYTAPVSLVTKLQLTTIYDETETEDTTNTSALGRSSKNGHARQKTYAEAIAEPAPPARYYIESQEDLYQTTEFIKFVVPFSIGVTCLKIWQSTATIFCVFGAYFDEFVGAKIRGTVLKSKLSVQKPGQQESRVSAT